MQESIQLVIDSLPFLLKGAGYTLQLSIGGMFFGLLLGFILALMRLSPIWPVRWLARFYISIFRGTPLIAQLFMIYYGLPQFGIELIRSVYSGQRYIASDIAQQMALSQIEPEKTESPFASLSERELQIMLMITKGQKVNEISEQLNLSPKTVNSYRYRMFSKLNIHGDVELTHLAIRHGLCNAETLSSQ